jgi:hypothetical protein
MLDELPAGSVGRNGVVPIEPALKYFGRHKGGAIRDGVQVGIDQDGFAEHAAHSRRRYHPSISAAVLVEPGIHFWKPLTETARRNGDLDADGKPAFGRCDHVARLPGILANPE